MQKNRRMNPIDKIFLIGFPFRKIRIPATLLIREASEMCRIVWDLSGKPMKMICHHILSTGNNFHGNGRFPKHPIAIGSRATLLG
jgi:hypothetical protein